MRTATAIAHSQKQSVFSQVSSSPAASFSPKNSNPLKQSPYSIPVAVQEHIYEKPYRHRAQVLLGKRLIVKFRMRLFSDTARIAARAFFDPSPGLRSMSRNFPGFETRKLLHRPLKIR
jgi:hypothetical protein